MQPSAFSHPTQECDVIMKGGITSGVVYPLAVVELAKTYRLRNIGGTSAGAIAAALAAAAEYGRDNPQGGFPKLAELPGFLAQKLTALFQPSPKARPAFNTLLVWISPGGKFRKTLLTLWNLIRFHPLAFLLGALLGLGLFWLVADFPSHGQLIKSRAMPLRVIAVLFWGFLVAGVAFVWRAVRAIRANAFGMCNGMPSHLRSREPALTPWMAGLLNEMSGKTGGPLTFGDLQGRQINLEVMTTNLTHGSPVSLPFSSREFFFHPGELESFFPGEIVEWMVRHPFEPEEDDEDQKEFIQRIVTQTPYRPLPAPADLPVVVAARMSLSFPVLISAIPLYAIDWTLTRNQELKKAGKAPELGRCWFSDGGIGSNFPVHFFDGLLPSRPTFGINLRPFHPDHPKDPHDESKNVRFPTAAVQGIRPTWTNIDGLFSFLGTIVNTMQNWVDNTQMRLPGYRDRVVHVHLTEDEGGMNLAMPPERVEVLTKRGLAAGQALQTIDWDGHRWTRYLTAVSQLQGRLDRVEEIYSQGFGQFLADRDVKQRPYRRTQAWKAQALKATADLMALVRTWRTPDEELRMDFDPPKPEPELRINPRR
ncbi:MAG TPA: SuhR protein [Thermoanaerobaculia bacterium]|nr:SuhR protein [Thermoanaerobaculia bacterium]